MRSDSGIQVTHSCSAGAVQNARSTQIVLLTGPVDELVEIVDNCPN
jgi:hypothetical protein